MALAILKSLWQVVKVILAVLKIPFIILCCSIVVFTIICAGWLIYYTKVQHIPVNHAVNNNIIKQPNVFTRLFWLAPKQFVYDQITKNPYFFPYQGMIIYEGRQGNGKTSTLVHDLNIIHKKCPYAEILTNFDYINENEKLFHWGQLLDYTNCTDNQAGVICAIDELQNWFSSKDSKNFDPQMLSIITQNRKNRRLIVGTAQQFYMLAKDIRTQCTEVRSCVTFLGCITIVHRKIPVVDSAGEVVEWKNKGFYFWVHTQEDRNSYDTWKCIERLRDAGFNRNESINVSLKQIVVKDKK